MGAHADRNAPVVGCFLLRDDDSRAAVEHNKLVGLLRALRQFAHQRHGIGGETTHRRMQLGQAEQLQGQGIAITVDPGDIATPHKAVEHAVKFVRAAVEFFGDLRLGEAPIDARQQLQNIQPLVERRRAVTVRLIVVRGHRSLREYYNSYTNSGGTSNEVGIRQ